MANEKSRGSPRKISLVAGEQTLLGCKNCALQVAALASLIVSLDDIRV
jgi:hypothetical protein